MEKEFLLALEERFALMCDKAKKLHKDLGTLSDFLEANRFLPENLGHEIIRHLRELMELESSCKLDMKVIQENTIGNLSFNENSYYDFMQSISREIQQLDELSVYVEALNVLRKMHSDDLDCDHELQSLKLKSKDFDIKKLNDDIRLIKDFVDCYNDRESALRYDTYRELLWDKISPLLFTAVVWNRPVIRVVEDKSTNDEQVQDVFDVKKILSNDDSKVIADEELNLGVVDADLCKDSEQKFIKLEQLREISAIIQKHFDGFKFTNNCDSKKWTVSSLDSYIKRKGRFLGPIAHKIVRLSASLPVFTVHYLEEIGLKQHDGIPVVLEDFVRKGIICKYEKNGCDTLYQIGLDIYKIVKKEKHTPEEVEHYYIDSSINYFASIILVKWGERMMRGMFDVEKNRLNHKKNMSFSAYNGGGIVWGMMSYNAGEYGVFCVIGDTIDVSAYKNVCNQIKAPNSPTQYYVMGWNDEHIRLVLELLADITNNKDIEIVETYSFVDDAWDDGKNCNTRSKNDVEQSEILDKSCCVDGRDSLNNVIAVTAETVARADVSSAGKSVTEANISFTSTDTKENDVFDDEIQKGEVTIQDDANRKHALKNDGKAILGSQVCAYGVVNSKAFNINLEKVRKDSLELIASDKFYCATALIKSCTFYCREVMPVYNCLAYAIGDPMCNAVYSAENIMNLYMEDNLNSYFTQAELLSSAMRCLFLDQVQYDYGVQSLKDMIDGHYIVEEQPDICQIIYLLSGFKKEYNSGIDRYADYRKRDEACREKEIYSVCQRAKDHYKAYVDEPFIINGKNKRCIETHNVLFNKNGELAQCLEYVKEDNRENVDLVKIYLQERFVENICDSIDETYIKPQMYDCLLDEAWVVAGNKVELKMKTQKLKGNYRTNILNHVKNAVNVMCKWVSLVENDGIKKDDTIAAAYSRLRKKILEHIANSEKTLSHDISGRVSSDMEGLERMAASRLLLYTLNELRSRLDGSYTEKVRMYFYVDFLRNSYVMLDDSYFPILDYQFGDLQDMSAYNCIRRHASEPVKEWRERLNEIIEISDDYGSASLILKYLENQKLPEYDEFVPLYEKVVYKTVEARAVNEMDKFVEGLELAQSYGQIMSNGEDKKDFILNHVKYFFDLCHVNQNYGFCRMIRESYMSMLKAEAKKRGVYLREQLDAQCQLHPEYENNELISKFIGQIKKMLEKQNYTAAEDSIDRLERQEFDEYREEQNDYLDDFLGRYDMYYKATNSSGFSLASNLSRRNKQGKGARRIIDAWPSNNKCNFIETTKELFTLFGFNVDKVEKIIGGEHNDVRVYLKKIKNGNSNYAVGVFGSQAADKPFRVVYLFGKYDADTLIEVFKKIGSSMPVIAVLDYSLNGDQRHRLARKTKEVLFNNVFAVVDRVAVYYLADTYEEYSINRRLISTVLPYAYYQPYITSAAHNRNMPVEMFIGRREALDKIINPNGENIIYGGRQLGKSALLHRAMRITNFNDNGDRAVFVDIKDMDYHQSALAISQSLVYENILSDNCETDDWNKLALFIKKRLLVEGDGYIPYLLLLIDEADAFIASCSTINYSPIDKLKDIQSLGNGRFKFVIAGLRNVVRFNKDALRNNSVMAHLKSYTVTPFSPREAYELLEKPLNYLGFRFSEESQSLISTILATTNYFPGLIQLYCSKLIETMKNGKYGGYDQLDTPPYNVTENHIKKVLAEKDFQKDIKEKFHITLAVDEDNYYHIIALLIAYIHHTSYSPDGYFPQDVLRHAKELGISKLGNFDEKQVYALLEEMRELNVFRQTAAGGYLFTRYSFFEMMGSADEVEEGLLSYAYVDDGVGV